MTNDNLTYKIYPDVELGTSPEIGVYVLLGHPLADGTILPTIIGANAVIRSHTIIYAGNNIGKQFRTGHGVLIRESNQIGHNVSIGSHTVIEHHVTIEDGVRIHSQSFVPEYTVLEEGCWIGPCVCLTNARYPLAHNVKGTLQGPTIGKGAIIGAGVVILPGLTIGAGAIIGAGAVVTHNVEGGAVVVGNPAHWIRDRESILDYQ